jgi:hypothetical protein
VLDDYQEMTSSPDGATRAQTFAIILARP